MLILIYDRGEDIYVMPEVGAYNRSEPGSRPCICIVDPGRPTKFNPQFNPIQMHWMKSDEI